jgi:hypothetical protein
LSIFNLLLELRLTILGVESTFSNVWSNLVSVGAPAAGLGTSA